MNKLILALTLVFLVLVQSDEKIQKALELGRDASNKLVDSVKSVLFQELGKGGYVGAIKACSNIAQDIIKTYQEKHGFYIRRVSEKYRNKLDKPDDYELKILRKLDELNKKGELPQEYYEVVEENGVRYLRYFKPLIVQPMCLNCHGSDEFLKKEIKEFLKEKYPDDKAVGYKAGDFRGAVSIKIKLSEDLLKN
ncbi:Protein of unknown function (DUF3365) [Candidatus Kryptonium thompsonii]|uniref:Tll0287-like domain-containing protein n=1 Tax=Candidatus Kryptonium thompsonii TaxID=1633631 RepID=A0A0P1M8W2_9BACT|nr:DUF3365 domain-containing protein [Candidatus Kryptonium thompsoni]CUS77508.1 Protein of unknown function (DUF3365) [Candidatus Kryptonium thompsoni]CUS90885.1 Protein of unknown function (DUF3365) [Candidatus Kryptonium thompsoni]CUS93350.1 Protein of unknown function (DUF3365) [Candidatus Kryptonium thompsoni]CUT02628.1 Protein of unknown function (DUF3365) [Candidatus Kryptonium thompsoni]CUT08063.1 Protein of unknown function (DUF3365) [Candidatus Kryptonium thompsoni]